jgi:hypothetical protein
LQAQRPEFKPKYWQKKFQKETWLLTTRYVSLDHNKEGTFY